MQRAKGAGSLFRKSGSLSFAAAGLGSTVSVSAAAMIAFRTFQLGNQSRLSQRSGRREDHRVFIFVVPEFFEAD